MSFILFTSSLGEDGMQIGSEGILPFLLILSVIIFRTSLELIAVNLHDV